MRGSVITNKLLPLCLIILGLLFGYSILHSGKQKPEGHSKHKSKRLRTVQTNALMKGSVEPYWHTSGFVISAESVKINARVSGNVAAINPKAVPGGLLKSGDWLATLETKDLELALASQQAQLEQAQANYKLEQADQVLAKEELQLLNSSDGLNIDEALVLRKPQLTVAKAKISVAQTNVDRAKLNLSRAKIVMPFDGKIITKDVGRGSKVSTNTPLFSIINTDTYWIETKIPHKFLTLLDKQGVVEISQPRLWGQGVKRQAKIISILPELDDKDRQVKVLLAIDQPLLEKSGVPQVFINDFLSVKLKGKPIKNAWTIKHSWLQADNTIWVVDKQKTLQKRPVEVLFKGRDVIYVRTKVKSGDRALAEKPGIASVGLAVRTRKDISSSIQPDSLKSNSLNPSAPKAIKTDLPNSKQDKVKPHQGLTNAK